MEVQVRNKNKIDKRKKRGKEGLRVMKKRKDRQQ